MPAEVLPNASVPVGQVSARTLATVAADASVRELAEELVIEELVREDDEIAGIVSMRDVLALLLDVDG
ncbi:MAG TPA: CBS domain-containing protein [Actinomycetospora sp.]|jgi:predicted transcriptional regulator|uniref:CBS domain-containing protein n=1 Tax=Actinomycetospora sp. TaxID=1872135 RepID=UPI002F3EC101